MKEIRQDFNFNDPVIATEIFRVQDAQGASLEYGAKIAFGWEDVKCIESYPYPDNWKDYKGPKYYIQLQGYPAQKLILGDRDSILTHWTMFRNKYPLFHDGSQGEDQSEGED